MSCLSILNWITGKPSPKDLQIRDLQEQLHTERMKVEGLRRELAGAHMGFAGIVDVMIRDARRGRVA